MTVLKNSYKAVLFIGILVLPFVGIQNVFTPSFSKYQNNQRIESGFDALPKNVIDYLVVGVSNSEYDSSLL